MFNIEDAIRNWRRKTQTSGRLEDGDIEELESHLRDLVTARVAGGDTEQTAFNAAVREIGGADDLGREYRLSRERPSVQVARKFLPALAVNYLIVMIRQFGRQRMHSWITVTGLSVGLASCLLIAMYVLHELSFDQEYAGRNLYRVMNRSLSEQGLEDADAGGPVAMGPALKEEFAEVKNAIRFWRAYRPTISYGDKMFEEQQFMLTDPDAFSVFGFRLIHGDPASVLSLPNSVAISQSMAVKYFGSESPLGKTLEYNGYPQGKLSFVITGVFADLPANTHFIFDFLASIRVATNEANNWGSFKPLWTYVEVADARAAGSMQEKLGAFADRHMEGRRKNRKEFELRLEPLESIYLHSHAQRPMKPGGSMTMIRVATLTGILILVMSCVNFVNISLARLSVRMKEVGLRKVFGAIRRQLAFQLIAEVIVTFGISLALAAAVIAMVAPFFTEITGVKPTMSSLLEWRFVATLACIFLFVVALSAYVPAMRMSGFTVTEAFRGRKGMPVPTGVFNFRNNLIFLQLAISGMLIMSVMVVHDQLTFISKKDLGLAVDQVIAIPYSANPEAFENHLRSVPGVESFGYSQRLPVNTISYDGRVVKIPGIENEVQVESCTITPDFLDTYRIEILAGRNLVAGNPADSNKFIINETAVKAFGWTLSNAVGNQLTWSGSITGEVIGVVKDFHLESVHATIAPLVMLSGENMSMQFFRTYLSIRLNAANAAEAEQAIEQQWRAFNNDRIFMKIRMNESYQQLHVSDRAFSEIVMYFMIIAIFISAIGLYSVSSYTAEQKRKEVGVRKVLGSTVAGIVYRLAAPFMVIAAATFVVVAPLVYLVMDKWLSTFAYHVAVSWITLTLGGLVVLALTLVSVLKESVRAAIVNPISFLREE